MTLLRTLRGDHRLRVGSLPWNNHILTTGGMEGRIINNHVQSHKNQMNPQLQSMNVQATSLDSTAQTGHGNGGDWQEEVYQKIKAMKESYLPELNEMYRKIADKLQQLDSLPHQPISDKVEKLKLFKTMLERVITFLQVSKTSILPVYKDKLASYEKQIISFINTNRPRKPVSSLQQGQPSSSHMHSMQQSQSQITQLQSHENQMNPQLQSMNVQGSVTTMQQNNITNMQQNSMSALSGISTAQLWQQQFHQQQMLQLLQQQQQQQQLLQQQQQAKQQQQQQLLQQQMQAKQLLQQQMQAKQQIPGQMQTHENQMNPELQILQSQQLHQQQMQLLQQQQQQLQQRLQSQSQSQITQVQSQLQSMNIQGSATTWIQDKEIH